MDLAIDFEKIFDDIPVALLIEDLSKVKTIIQGLQENGITDFQAYFDEYPQSVIECYQAIHPSVILNKAMLDYFKASSYEELMHWIDNGDAFNSTVDTNFKPLFIAFAQGKTQFSKETVEQTMDGTFVHAYVTWKIATGWEDSWGRVIVSAIPLQEA